MNGDGFDDVIVGAPSFDGNMTDRGGAYVVFGHAGPFPSLLSTALLDGNDGFEIQGSSGDSLGLSVAGAGDINGDGFDDVIVGAPGADGDVTDAGAAFVVLGKAGGFQASTFASLLTPPNGFKLGGIAANDRAGESVGGAGDVNGDGLDDVVIGAPGFEGNGTQSRRRFRGLRQSGTSRKMSRSPASATAAVSASSAQPITIAWALPSRSSAT